MMAKLKIYLDTSVFSAYLDTRARSRQDDTKVFWNTLEKYEGFTSQITIKELMAVKDEKLRKDLIELTTSFKILSLDEEIQRLAEKYIESGIIPKRYFEDALHLAVATANGIDILVSWNFEHMVKRKTRLEVNLTNSITGYRSIDILAPPEL